MSEVGSSSAQPLKKQRWAPTKHLTEAPHPPIIDHRQDEEAAAHQAAQEAGYEGRRVRKFLQRRTVDYNESFHRWKLHRNTITCVRDDRLVWPGVNHIVELLPAAAYRSSAQAVTTNLVHSSTNKIRNPVNVIHWTPEGRRLLGSFLIHAASKDYEDESLFMSNLLRIAKKSATTFWSLCHTME